MAVEAQHLHLFPTQLIGNPVQLMGNRGTIIDAIENNNNLYNSQMSFGVSMPGTENFIPFYNSSIADSIPATTTKADSGLTCNLSVPRKRYRESINNPFISMAGVSPEKNCSPFYFLGEDISLRFQQQQLEIDRFIAQNTEKMRLELEERRKRHSRFILAAVEERIAKRLKAKEEQIEKVGKLNWALEEKVKSLCMENQIWRDLAQNSEATANALRSNLEQLLAHVKDERQIADDAESCCDSSNEGGGEEEQSRRTLENTAEIKKENDRYCRNCGKKESSVLLLPCRHLCLCTVCASTIHTCPVCKSTKNSSVYVNMST